VHRFLENKHRANEILTPHHLYIILKSVSEGLNYLHFRPEGTIIHRKKKITNINNQKIT